MMATWQRREFKRAARGLHRGKSIWPLTLSSVSTHTSNQLGVPRARAQSPSLNEASSSGLATDGAQ